MRLLELRVGDSEAWQRKLESLNFHGQDRYFLVLAGIGRGQLTVTRPERHTFDCAGTLVVVDY